MSEEPGPAGQQPPAMTPPVPVLASGRSFMVEAYVGKKAGGWPFARFDVGPAGLRVRVPFPWFAVRSAARAEVTAVSVGRRIGRYCIRFEDSFRSLADVHVHPPFRPDRVIDELRACGYAVIDRDTGAEIDRLPRRLRRRRQRSSLVPPSPGSRQ